MRLWLVKEIRSCIYSLIAFTSQDMSTIDCYLKMHLIRKGYKHRLDKQRMCRDISQLKSEDDGGKR